MPPKQGGPHGPAPAQVFQVQSAFAFHTRYDGDTNPHAFFEDFERALDAQGRSQDPDARKCALLAMALQAESRAAMSLAEYVASLAGAAQTYDLTKQHLINDCWTYHMKASECDGVHKLEMKSDESPRAFMTRFAVALAKANRARVALGMPR